MQKGKTNPKHSGSMPASCQADLFIPINSMKNQRKEKKKKFKIGVFKCPEIFKIKLQNKILQLFFSYILSNYFQVNAYSSVRLNYHREPNDDFSLVSLGWQEHSRVSPEDELGGYQFQFPPLYLSLSLMLL